MQTTLFPVTSSERIQALDFLRGVAILGILIMNIQSFAMPGAAYTNPTAFGDLNGINRWVWMLSHLLGDQKFMTIFSLLYGAGIVMIAERAKAKAARPASLHFRRTFWLLIIGLIHAHLIWYGDILVSYALCALFVYFFRKLRPLTLLIIGVLFVSMHTLLYWFFGTSLEHWPVDALNLAKSSWQPTPEEIEAEINAVTGSLLEQIKYNSQSALFLEILVFPVLFLWRAGGLMLVGMAMYKWGILSGLKSSRFYQLGLLCSWLLGFPIVIYGLVQNFETDWNFHYSMYLGSQYNYWGSLPISFGYICITMLIIRSKALPWIRIRLAAVGQMALTNYLSQSIICIIIFYGIGFGLFGRLDRVYQIGILVPIWLLQILWSKPWLDRYRFGPAEWMWRSLTYLKFQPFIKKQKVT
ncbi:MAG: DUF418 domain-containing protein [Saprospiraceae bacterium]|nr:DUF418 domain-containing protein [Saprospiraceae bacterium]